MYIRKVDLEKVSDRFKIGNAEGTGFPIYKGEKLNKAIFEELYKKRDNSIPKIYRFLSKLGQDLWDINKIKPHHIETAHDIHALYTVKEPEISKKSVFPQFSMLRSGVEMNGRYIHVQTYPGFSFEPYSKEEEVCLAACYHTQPRDHIVGEEPSICLGWLADQKNYGFEETEDVARLILKNIQGIERVTT